MNRGTLTMIGRYMMKRWWGPSSSHRTFSHTCLRVRWTLLHLLTLLVASPLPARAQVADNPPYTVITPNNYNTFLPPAMGGSYVDPAFGTTVTRLSDATKIIGSSGNVNSL